MIPKEAEARLLHLLAEAGVGGSSSDPLRVWRVFKRFALETVECEMDYLLFQAGDSEVQHDSYLDFCREFKLRDTDDVVWYEQVHAEFSAQRPLRLGFKQMHRWSYDYDSLIEFFTEVERLPEFRVGVVFRPWSFRAYHTGV